MAGKTGDEIDSSRLEKKECLLCWRIGIFKSGPGMTSVEGIIISDKNYAKHLPTLEKIVKETLWRTRFTTEDSLVYMLRSASLVIL